MQKFFNFLTNNKDLIDIVIKILAFLGITSVAGLFRWGIQRYWRTKLRVDSDCFDVIDDSSKLLSTLYGSGNDDGPLAPQNILYQRRNESIDTQTELRLALNKKNYLLVTGPKGYGKTREAGMLIASLMSEGYRVIRIRPNGWLNAPKEFPKNLNSNRFRVIIFLDDINGLFRSGDFMQNPLEQEIPLAPRRTYHDRLLEFIDAITSFCHQDEVKVIATARTEPNDWEVLKFNLSDSLWGRFELVELEAPDDSVIIKLLDVSAKSVGLTIQEKDLHVIARKNDRSYENIILNLRRVFRSKAGDISAKDFTEKIDNLWQELYEREVRKLPTIKYIYDSISLLKQASVELYLPIVEELAITLMAGNNLIKRFISTQKIKQTINYITYQTKIMAVTTNYRLSPRDGQIEARRDKIELQNHVFLVGNTLLFLAKRHPENTLLSIIGFCDLIYRKGFEKYSIEILEKATALFPNSSIVWLELGIALQGEKNNKKAEEAFKKAIVIAPELSEGYYRLADVYKTMNEGESAQKILETMPDAKKTSAQTYYLIGEFLRNRKKFSHAENILGQSFALEQDPITAASIEKLLAEIEHDRKLKLESQREFSRYVN